MPGIIFNPFRQKDLQEPSLSMLNEFWRKLAEQINELWGLAGPVLLNDDLDLQGHSILNASLAGAAASSSSAAPSLYGPHSNRPDASGVAEGTLYLETDRTVLYQLQLVSSVKRWVYIAGIMQGLFSGRPLASSLGPGDSGLLYHASDNGQVYRFSYPAWSIINLRGPMIEGTNAERLAGGRYDAKNLAVGTEFFETDTLARYMVQVVAGVNTWVAEPAANIDVQKAGVLVGTRSKVNFTEDGNIVLTMADNPGQTRVDIGIKATGAGDVIGPGSATDSDFAGFDGTTGKLIKDSSSKAADFAPAGYIPQAQVARAHHSANQSIPNVTYTTLNFDTNTFTPVPPTMHDPATSNSKFVAPVAGKYLVKASISFETNPTGDRRVILRLNGASGTTAVFQSSPAAEPTIQISDILSLAANDYIEARVFQSSGGTLLVVWGATDTSMAMYFLGGN